ncbi:MAG: hypothetical protein ACR2NM_17865 [Bythopirellula sp.]
MSESFAYFSAVAEPLWAVDITGPYVIQLVSRVLHILSAIILVGGLFYLRTVLAPAGDFSPEQRNQACFADRRAVWAKWVGLASAFLIVSGLYNLMQILGQAKADGVELPPTYHMLFGIKFLLALLVMFIASILAGKTPLADRFRGQMRKWLNIGWLAAIATIVLAAILRTLH